MKFQKLTNRNPHEINAGSMADIAFLLLIFFLVSTTIDSDQGILVRLPPISEKTDPPQAPSRNICSILINSDNQIMVRGKQMQIEAITDYLKEFISNPHQASHLASSPKKAIVSFQNDRNTLYARYIEVYNEIKKAYNELRNELAQMRYGALLDLCNAMQKAEIRREIPLILSETEPTSYGN